MAGIAPFLTPDRAQVHVLETRRVGYGRCLNCARDIFRAKTVGTIHDQRPETYEEDASGRWWLNPIDGVMHYGAVDGQLDRYRLHSCDNAPLLGDTRPELLGGTPSDDYS